jgi:hypothetical protein
MVVDSERLSFLIRIKTWKRPTDEGYIFHDHVTAKVVLYTYLNQNIELAALEFYPNNITVNSSIKMDVHAKAVASNIANTVWPTQGIPDHVKDLIGLLLQLLDDKSDDAGPRLAEEVFTSDGQLGAAHKSAKGSAGTSSFQTINSFSSSSMRELPLKRNNIFSNHVNMLILIHEYEYRDPRSPPNCLGQSRLSRTPGCTSLRTIRPRLSLHWQCADAHP